MTLEGFLEITETRIPTVLELVELCYALDIKFKGDGSVLGVPHASKEEGRLLAALFKREPFRTMVLDMVRKSGKVSAGPVNLPAAKDRPLRLLYANGSGNTEAWYAEESPRMAEMPTHFDAGNGWEKL